MVLYADIHTILEYVLQNYDWHGDGTKGIVNITGYLGGPALYAPIPELPTIMLHAVGMLALPGCVRMVICTQEPF